LKPANGASARQGKDTDLTMSVRKVGGGEGELSGQASKQAERMRKEKGRKEEQEQQQEQDARETSSRSQ